MRYLAKLKINIRKKAFSNLPVEQVEIYNFTKALIRNDNSQIIYCPNTGTILIRNEMNGKGILVKGEVVTVIKEDNLITTMIDSILRDLIVSYISNIAESKVSIAEQRYKNHIKEFNRVI